MCNGLKKELKLSLSQSDLRHRGIERSKVYLTKVAKVPFPSSSSEWEKIKILQDIRNHLSHGSSPIPEGEKGKKLKQGLDNFTGLGLDQSNIIRIEADFLLEVTKLFLSFHEKSTVEIENYLEGGLNVVDNAT